MTSAIQGLAVITLALVATTPLRAAQVGDSPAAHPPSAEAADTATERGGHDHHPDTAGGKHGAGHKSLSFDSTTNTVTFKLGRRHANGRATLVVPPKSHLVMRFGKEDSLPHSAAIVGDEDRIEAQGLPLHGTDVVRLTAPASGTYRIVSGVPGQTRSGMSIRLRVDPTAKAPSWEKHS